MSEKECKKQAQRRSVPPKAATKKVACPSRHTVASPYSQTNKYDSSRATKKASSQYTETSNKSAKLSAADSHSNDESSSSASSRSASSKSEDKERKDSSQTETPLQGKSANATEPRTKNAVPFDSTTRSKSNDDIVGDSVLPSDDTHTADNCYQKSESNEFQGEAEKSVTAVTPPLPPLPVSPSQKGGEIAAKVEELATTEVTLARDTPLLSSSSTTSSPQPPPPVEAELSSVTPAPLMGAKEAELENTPVESPQPPPIGEPLDVTSAPIVVVKETELETPPLSPPSPVHNEISGVITVLVTTEDEPSPTEEPPLSATSGHSADVEVANESATSAQQSLADDDILPTAEVPLQEDGSDDPMSALPAQESQTNGLERREEDMATTPISREETLPPLSSPHQESITTGLEPSMDDDNGIVSLHPSSEETQTVLPLTPPQQESQSKPFVEEEGKDVDSAPPSNHEESPPLSPSLPQGSATIGLESSSGNEADTVNYTLPPKDQRITITTTHH